MMLYPFKNLFYFRGRQTETEGQPAPVHSRGWARLQLGARHSVQISPGAAGTQSFEPLPATSMDEH